MNGAQLVSVNEKASAGTEEVLPQEMQQTSGIGQSRKAAIEAVIAKGTACHWREVKEE